MKKLMRYGLALLCCMGLTACQAMEGTKSDAPAEEAEEQDLRMTAWDPSGVGNDDGYYQIRQDEEGVSRLTYIDAASGKEVYLCQKPECRHEDERCTAFVPFALFAGQLLVDQDHLYIVSSGTGASVITDEGVQAQAEGPVIEQMDLDGQNRRTLFQLEEGYQFHLGNVVFDDHALYIPVDKSEQVMLDDRSSMVVSLETTLYRIDLNSGEAEAVKDMKDEDILDAEGRTIIFEEQRYPEDPQQYLDAKDYERYNAVLTQAKKTIERYDIDTGKSERVETDIDTIEAYQDGNAYWIEEGQVMRFSLQSKTAEEVIDLPKDGGQYFISALIADHLLIESVDDEQDTADQMYALSLSEPQLTPLHQFIEETKEPVQILHQTSDELLVIYDKEGQMEMTWAGTMQFETERAYYGYISIDDFLHDQRSYDPVETLA